MLRPEGEEEEWAELVWKELLLVLLAGSSGAVASWASWASAPWILNRRRGVIADSVEGGLLLLRRRQLARQR